MYFDSKRNIVIILTDDDEGIPLKRIKTGCGVTVSPAAPAEVIVYGPDGSRVVFEAAYASLPDGCLVVAVKNGSGAFPETDPDLKVRIILDPYQACDVPEVVEMSLNPWFGGGCPVCGTLSDADLDDDRDGDGEDPDDDSDDDWSPDAGDDTPHVEVPVPSRFTFFEPSAN